MENNKFSQQIGNLKQKLDKTVNNIEGMIGVIMQALARLNATIGLGQSYYVNKIIKIID